MNRRMFLTGVSATAIGGSGCMAWGGPPYCRSGYAFSLQPVNYASVPERIVKTDAEMSEIQLITNLISTILDGEAIILEIETNLNLFQQTPDKRDRIIFFKREGTFYEISIETLEEGTVTGPKYKVSRNGTSPDDLSSGNVLPMSDLPYHDQWRLYENLSILDTGGVRVFSDSFVAGYLDSAYQTESMLVDGIDQQFIEYNGRYIKIEKDEEGTASIYRKQFSSEPIATSAETAGEYLIEQNAIESTNLSADGRDLVEELTEERMLEFCVTVAGGESDSIEEPTESERNAINELESKSENTVFADYHEDVLYIQYEGDMYEISWENTGSVV